MNWKSFFRLRHMKLSSKWYRHTIALTALLVYFHLLYAGLMPCCSFGLVDSHVSYGDVDGQGCKHCADKHERNMNVPAMTLASPSNHNHDCGCEEIKVSNYILEEHKSSYRSMKSVRFRFFLAASVNVIPNTTGMLSHVQHFLSPLIGSSATQSIRTVVILI